MNYRHAFHAGNHCDVLKHLTLALILERLGAKDKPFEALDTHAGRGLYDLSSPDAARSGEHFGGIAKVYADPAAPPAFAPYFAAIARQNPFGGLRWYPGSPVIIAEALRAGDSAKFCELHPEEDAALSSALEGCKGVRIFAQDGFQGVRAFLPPAARRGLVLIDPPFEEKGEYGRLAEALADGVRRFATGVFMIWRPIKDDTGYRAFKAAAAALAPPKTLEVELSVAAPTPDKLTGSGLFIVNPPYGLSDALEPALDYLAPKLAKAEGAAWSLVEIENGAIVKDAHGGAA